MTKDEVMVELKKMGNESTKKIFMKHGAKEPYYGVKVGDLKKIQKKVKKDHSLALELYATGVGDAMYLAGLIADEKSIKKSDLKKWAKDASWYMISEYTVPWIAADSPFGYELGLEWIESKDEKIAASGWSTLSNVAIVKPNEELDIKHFKKLLDQVGKEIHQSKNRVRYAMNAFVIAVGGYIPELTEHAKKIGTKVGKVDVDMGGTACKVPLITEYIKKIEDRGSIGKKKKTARC